MKIITYMNNNKYWNCLKKWINWWSEWQYLLQRKQSYSQDLLMHSGSLIRLFGNVGDGGVSCSFIGFPVQSHSFIVLSNLQKNQQRFVKIKLGYTRGFHMFLSHLFPVILQPGFTHPPFNSPEWSEFLAEARQSCDRETNVNTSIRTRPHRNRGQIQLSLFSCRIKTMTATPLTHIIIPFVCDRTVPQFPRLFCRPSLQDFGENVFSLSGGRSRCRTADTYRFAPDPNRGGSGACRRQRDHRRLRSLWGSCEGGKWNLPMPVRGGGAVLLDWGTVGTPAVGFIPVVLAGSVESIFTWQQHGEEQEKFTTAQWFTVNVNVLQIEFLNLLLHFPASVS